VLVWYPAASRFDNVSGNVFDRRRSEIQAAEKRCVRSPATTETEFMAPIDIFYLSK
jgi:hypothetical protein